jgi:hypothetical protein
MEKNIRTLTADEIECRVGPTTSGAVSLLLYKDARVDMRLLDEHFGAMNWERTHEIIDGNLYCTISVFDIEKRQWVSKQDVGVESNTEKEKGQASDSFKRAAVNWGIGRELYSAPSIWVNLNQDEMNNGKIKSSVKFYVKSIGYNDNREITSLVIVDKKGNVRFSMNAKTQPTPTPAPQPQPAPVPQPTLTKEQMEKAKRDKIVIDYLYAHPADEQWYLDKSGKKDMLELNLDNVYIHLKQNNKI